MEMGRGLWDGCALAEGMGRGRGLAVVVVAVEAGVAAERMGRSNSNPARSTTPPSGGVLLSPAPSTVATGPG
jgi:hypothetical protein